MCNEMLSVGETGLPVSLHTSMIQSGSLGARVLGEFGDDSDRYADVKSRRNHAGTSSLTIASGKMKAVIAPCIRNHWLYDAVDRWAYSSITASLGCRSYYVERKSTGDAHAQALRALGNRLVGILNGCVRTRTASNEQTAWSHRQHTPETIAA
jgi:hypothetical protein